MTNLAPSLDARGSTLKSGAVPKVHSARPMPFPMRKAVDTELRRLVDQSVIEEQQLL